MKTIFIQGPKGIMGEDKITINKGKDTEKSYSCIAGNSLCKALVNVSNEPNVRAVNEHAPVLDSIEHTLLFEPEMMPIRNNGITLIASSFKYNDKRRGWEIVLKEGDGIINGGHTSYVINNLYERNKLVDFAKVPIRVFESSKLNEEDIANMSACLNYTCAPKLSTLIDKKGLVDYIKANIDKDFFNKIEWRENTGEGKENVDFITLDTLLMLLSLFDIKEYGYYNHKKEKNIVKSPKKVIEKYEQEKLNFDYLMPIMEDILRLYDEILISLTRLSKLKKGKIKKLELIYENSRSYFGENGSERKTVFTKETYNYEVALGYLYVILTSFRANITIDKNGEVKWIVPDVIAFYRSIEKDIWSAILSSVTVSVKKVTTMKDGVRIEEKQEYIDVSANTKHKMPIWEKLWDVVDKAVLKYENANYKKELENIA